MTQIAATWSDFHECFTQVNSNWFWLTNIFVFKHFQTVLGVMTQIAGTSNDFNECFTQVNSIWRWSDGRPVGMQLWAPPHSLPKLTGRSCMVLHDTFAATGKVYRNTGTLLCVHGVSVFSFPFFVTLWHSSKLQRIFSVKEDCDSITLNQKKLSEDEATTYVCSVLSVYNLENPQWHPVACNTSFLVDVLCTNRWHTEMYNHNLANYTHNISLGKTISCPLKEVLFKNKCIYFSRHPLDHRNTGVTNWFWLEGLLRNIGKVSESPVYFQLWRKASNFFLTLDKLTRRINEVKQKAGESINIFNISFSKSTNTDFDKGSQQLQIFKCSSGEYISVSFLLDGKTDCINKDDESKLYCFVDGKYTNDSLCKTSCTKQSNCRCPNLFYQSAQGGCFPYSKQCGAKDKMCKEHHVRENSSTDVQHLTTKSSKKAQHRKVTKRQSFHTDCTLIELKTFEKDTILMTKHCKVPDEMMCTYGCSRCFPVSKLCVFEIHLNFSLMYCPSGAHLKNCQEMECNNMFKCYNSYCTPYKHLCDGTWECPHGEDEVNVICNLSRYNCFGFFRCSLDRRMIVTMLIAWMEKMSLVVISLPTAHYIVNVSCMLLSAAIPW